MRLERPKTGGSVAALTIVPVLTPFLAAAQPAAVDGSAAGTPPTVALPSITVIGGAPLLGSGIDRNKLPAQSSVLNSGDLKRQGPPNFLGALEDQVGGITLSSSSGNPDQPALLYHGFEASPLQGTPQGLAVYVDGVRFNAPFGDAVNWELIPNIAIDQLNLEGPNPVFGLNALGGSISVRLKDGFTHHGAELNLFGGSFGRVVGELQYGKQAGDVAVYMAGSVRHQDGWRDLQSSDVQNLYADLGWRGTRAEAHLSFGFANSVLNGPGTSPVELLAVDPAAQFTAPNKIANRYATVNLRGNYDVTETTSIQGLAYYRHLLQRVVNGNSPNDTPCGEDSGNAGFLCLEDGSVSTGRGGFAIPDFLAGAPYSELDSQTTNTNAYGVSIQATNTGDLFGLQNHFVAGFSYDGAVTQFGATALIGGLAPFDRVFVGPGIPIEEPGVNVPVRLSVTDNYYGFYLSDTLNLTSRLAITLSGRFNSAQITLSDQGGGALTGQHAYNRFNPSAGLTYEFAPALTVYAGYSEANRAPTPAELSCASPTDTCSLANFFVGDPHLNQVAAHSFEAGIRGTIRPAEDVRVTYNLGLFRTTLDDDIHFVNAATLNRAFFQNIGQTRRQGIDASLQFKSPRWLAYAAYTYTDATFQTGFTEAAGSNPAGDADGNITIRPGNRLPGVPAHQLKLGAHYKITDRWTVGAVGICQSGQYLFGDPANLTAKLPGFFTLNLTTQYQLTPNIQLYGVVENVTDAKYYTYGTFSPTASIFLAQAPNATNPRSYSPAAPIGGFGGVRITF